MIAHHEGMATPDDITRLHEALDYATLNGHNFYSRGFNLEDIPKVLARLFHPPPVGLTACYQLLASHRSLGCTEAGPDMQSCGGLNLVQQSMRGGTPLRPVVARYNFYYHPGGVSRPYDVSRVMSWPIDVEPPPGETASHPLGIISTAVSRPYTHDGLPGVVMADESEALRNLLLTDPERFRLPDA